MIVDVYRDQETVSDEQTNVTLYSHTHLSGHQEVSVIRVYRTLATVVYPVILIHLTLRVIVLELKHDVCEAVYGVELFRSVPLNFVKVQIGTDSPWGVRSLVGSWCGMGWE